MLAVVMLCCVLGFCGTAQAATPGSSVTSAKKVPNGKWVKSGNTKKYRYSDGSYAKNIWLRSGNGVYRMDARGNMKTGMYKVGKATYYSGTNGKVFRKKWLTKDGDKYYFQQDGKMAQYKWLKIGNKYYFFLKSGRLARNQMLTLGGKTYYVNASGVRVKSTWIKKNNKKYYFGSNGVRYQNKWIKSGGKYYYLGSDGAMVTNRWVGDYYVGANGTRLTNCVVDGYYLNSKGKRTVRKFTGDYIFVGDSRTVGVQMSKAPADTKYIAKNGMGYEWLKSTGGQTLQSYLKLNPNVKVVLALGVNDLGNVNSYIKYYKNLMKKYPKTEFYVLSVNPVDEKKEASHGYKIKNSTIRSFNRKMYKAFHSSYVNTYDYLIDRGFETRDGLHYTRAIYRDLYDYIIQKIK